MRLLLWVMTLTAMLAGTSRAAPVLSPEMKNDDQLATYLAAQGVMLPVDEVAVAQGIIGNNKMTGRRAELGLTGLPSLTNALPFGGGAQHVWGTGRRDNDPEAFTLRRTGDVLSFEIAGYTGSMTGALVPLIDGLVFRTQGREERGTSSATLSDLTLDGVNYGSVTDGARNKGIRVLDGIGEGDFTLTGFVTLDWTGKRPRKAELGFQILAFDTPVPVVTPVPEPATALLLLGGLAGLTAVRRRVRAPA